MTLSTLGNLFRYTSFIFYLIWYLIDFKKTHMISSQKKYSIAKISAEIIDTVKVTVRFGVSPPPQKHYPLFFAKSRLKSANCPNTLFRQSTLYIVFARNSPPTKIWIFRWIPIILIFLLNPPSLLLKVISLLKHAHILP